MIPAIYPLWLTYAFIFFLIDLVLIYLLRKVHKSAFIFLAIAEILLTLAYTASWAAWIKVMLTIWAVMCMWVTIEVCRAKEDTEDDTEEKDNIPWGDVWP